MFRQFNDVNKFITKYKNTSLNSSEKNILEQFEELWEKAMSTAINLLEINSQSETEYKKLISLNKKLDIILESQETDVIQVEINKKNEDAQTYLKIINIIIGSGFIILLFIIYFLVFSITKPLNQLLVGFNAVGEGKLDTRLEINSRDEMQQLADFFNKMVDNLEMITVSKSYVDNIIGSMLNMLIILDNDHKIIRTNKFVSQILGFTKEELNGSNINEYFFNKEHRLIKNDNVLTSIISESYFKCKNNQSIPVLFNKSELKDKNEKIIGYVCIAQDMTKIKEIEKERNKIEIQKTQVEKKRAEERGILLKEIHHRVKNNLQIIKSLLNLQSHTIENNEVNDLFKQSQFRINSMAIIHEMLYQTEDFTQINFSHYIEKLVSDLINSYKGSEHHIHTNIDIKNIHFNVDTSIPLGLIINEIISNSLKHGFRNIDSGTISIDISKSNPSDFILRIGDDGIGESGKINFNVKKSLGLNLISGLTKQLNGSIEMDKNKKGINYIIEFQEI